VERDSMYTPRICWAWDETANDNAKATDKIVALRMGTLLTRSCWELR
jgi:hypothetical protein